MRRSLAAAVALLLPLAAATAQSTPTGPDAAAVMQQVESDATASHKAILLQFGASWCGNCRLFDRFLEAPAIHPILSRVFVFADIAAGERADDSRHKNLPGSVHLMEDLAGKNPGFPAIVMLDDKGKLLATSIRPGKPGNIGYPASPDEIAWFLTMLRKSAPSLTPQELSTIQTWLQAHASTHA